MNKTLALALLLACVVSGAAAEGMRIFVSDGAMEAREAAQLTALLERAFPQAEWTLEHEAQCGETLAQLVMDDRSPQLAICTPVQALPWAREGLLVPLTQHITDQKSIAPAVLDACTEEEELFIMPLLARHRQMAVNRRIMEKHHMGYLLNPIEHPAWLTSQFYQVLEEMMLTGQPSMEIWPVEPESCEAIAALLQTLYGGCFFPEEGGCAVDTDEIHAAAAWLRDAADQEMIACAQSREEALERFVSGETAMFLDWTDGMEQRCAAALEKSGVDVVALPYPSSSGDVARVFELTGAAVFDGGDEETNALAVKAAVFLNEDVQAQLLLGDRAVYRDEAQWLAALGMSAEGVTLRALLCDVLQDVMSGKQGTQELSTVQAAMDAMR